MSDSAVNTTSPKFTKSRNSNSPLHIQIKSKFQFEFVPRDTEKSESLDLVDSGGVGISVENVIMTQCYCDMTHP